MEAKLKGILVADICGFSRLVQKDEGGTLAEVVSLRDRIVLPVVERHGGTIANRAGDGVLAIFDTALGAMNCAKALLTESADFAPRFSWRVGLHLADIYHEGDTVHGHGVNLATRIEAFADPGSVVVTQPFFEALGETQNKGFRKIGRRKLKNISPAILLYSLRPGLQPPSAFAGSRLAIGFTLTLLLIGAGLMIAQRTGSTATSPPTAAIASLENSASPSVAVLPFLTLSQGYGSTGFERAIAAEIITDLTRFTGLKVFALSSMQRFQDSDLQNIRAAVGADYVVSGTVQRDANMIRVSVELAETETARVLWAKRFEAPTDETFDVQLEIAKQVVTVVGPVGKGTGVLGEREWQRAAKTKPQDMRAYDHFLLGRASEASGDAEAARVAYLRALELDPGYGRASARIAWTYAGSYWSGRGDPALLAMAREASERAMTLSPFDNEVLRIHGAVLLLSGQHALGLETLAEATELNPGDADTLMWYGWGLTFVGRSANALDVMQDAKARNPYPPGWYDWDLAWAHFFAGTPEETIKLLGPKAKRTPNDYFLLAAAQARMGLIEEMEQTSAAFRDAFPKTGWAAMARAQPFSRDHDRLLFEKALALTSIPKRPPDPD